MKMFNKVILVCVIVFLPMVVSAADRSFIVLGEKKGTYIFSATVTGNTNGTLDNFGINATTKQVNLTGVDPNATVRFSLTSEDGNKAGLYIIKQNAEGTKTATLGTVEYTVGALQNKQIGARILEDRLNADKEEIAGNAFMMNVAGAGTADNSNSLLSALSKPKDKPATTSSDTPGSVNDFKSQSDQSAGASGSKITLVPCDGTDVGGGTACTIEKLKDMAANIYNYLAGFGALVAVGVIVVAGFSYIKSAGDPSKMKEAKQKIVYAIIGLVVLGASVVIVNTALTWLGSKTIDRVEDISG